MVGGEDGLPLCRRLCRTPFARGHCARWEDGGRTEEGREMGLSVANSRHPPRYYPHNTKVLFLAISPSHSATLDLSRRSNITIVHSYSFVCPPSYRSSDQILWAKLGVDYPDGYFGPSYVIRALVDTTRQREHALSITG